MLPARDARVRNLVRTRSLMPPLKILHAATKAQHSPNKSIFKKIKRERGHRGKIAYRPRLTGRNHVTREAQTAAMYRLPRTLRAVGSHRDWERLSPGPPPAPAVGTTLIPDCRLLKDWRTHSCCLKLPIRGLLQQTQEICALDSDILVPDKLRGWLAGWGLNSGLMQRLRTRRNEARGHCVEWPKEVTVPETQGRRPLCGRPGLG